MPPLSLRPVSASALRSLLTGCVTDNDATDDATDGLEAHE